MMKLQPIQYGFSSGEITPRLLGNTQADVYRNGVAELYNMIPLAHGPALSRDGSLFIGEAGNSDDIRLLPFNVSTGDDYVIELGPLYMRIYDRDGRVDLNDHNHIDDPTFAREFFLWNDISTGGSVTFTHTLLAVHLNNLTGSLIAAINQHMDDLHVTDVGVLHRMTGTFAGDGALHIEIGTSEGLADVLDVTVSVAGDFSFPVTPTEINNWIQFTNTGAANTTATLMWPKFEQPEDAIELVTPYLAEELAGIQYEMISSTGTLILAHSNHPPAQITLLAGTDFQYDPIIFDTPPTAWVINNYPNVVTVFQGRLWLARTPNELQTFWASQSGDYYNFDKGTALDNEGLEFDLASQGEIEWMVGQKDLMLGTDLGEHRITAESGVIKPSDIDIRQQSAYGSAAIQAQNIGDQVLYVSPDNLKVRALTFDAFQQGWYSPDITWISEHITRAGIKEIHFARDPSTLILCLLNDGTVAVCTYDRSQKALGWSLFDLGSLDIVSMAVVNGSNGSIIIGAGKQGNGVMSLLLSPSSLAVAANMDSAIIRPVEAGNVVTGLEHLEGMEVAVKVQNAVHPNKTVVGGQITLDYTDTLALVGLAYTSRMKTLPLDVGSTNGTGSGNLKHWAKIYVRLIDSANPKINGIRPPTREAITPMNEVQPNLTVDLQATDLGRTRTAQITIEQDLPLQLTVLNLFGIEGQDYL
jgi:hypothetical protein